MTIASGFRLIGFSYGFELILVDFDVVNVYLALYTPHHSFIFEAHKA